RALRRHEGVEIEGMGEVRGRVGLFGAGAPRLSGGLARDRRGGGTRLRAILAPALVPLHDHLLTGAAWSVEERVDHEGGRRTGGPEAQLGEGDRRARGLDREPERRARDPADALPRPAAARRTPDPPP